MIFKPLKKKKKFGLNQTSTPSQSPTVKLLLDNMEQELV